MRFPLIRKNLPPEKYTDRNKFKFHHYKGQAKNYSIQIWKHASATQVFVSYFLPHLCTILWFSLFPQNFDILTDAKLKCCLFSTYFVLPSYIWSKIRENQNQLLTGIYWGLNLKIKNSERILWNFQPHSLYSIIIAIAAS